MSQQGDVLLYQTNDGGEINVVNGLVEMSGGLETALYMSLFGGNEDDNGINNNPLTWWGNQDEIDPALKYISETQFLLKSLPAITGNLNRLKEAAKRDTKWLIDKKVASSVNITVTIPAINSIKITVETEAKGILSSFDFVENWKALKPDIIDDIGKVSIDVAPLTVVAIPVNLTISHIIEVDAPFRVDWGDGEYIEYIAGQNPSRIAKGPVRILSDTATQIKFITNSFLSIDIQRSSTLTNATEMCLNNSLLKLFNIDDASNITNFDQAWASCLQLVSFPLIDTSSGTNFDQAWASCLQLVSFPLIDTSSGTNFNSTWGGCGGLTSFPAIDTSNGLSFDLTFVNNVNLICLSSLNTTNATSATATFIGCTSLIAPTAGEQISLTTVPPGLNYINPGSCP